MRIVKALAAVLTGILLLGMPAVAMPHAPADRAGDECSADEAEKQDEQDGKETKPTAEEPSDPCAPKHKCAAQEDPDVVGTTTCVLGVPALP